MTPAHKIFAAGAQGSVAKAGEEALIRAVRVWLGPAAPPAPRGMGDDCAVLRAPKGRELLTIDPVVLGVHFDDRTPAEAVGAKLLKRNLSDIAAMGGRPRAAVVALALDGRTTLRWLEAFYRGLARESRRHEVPVVGGDVTRLDGAFVATLALTGEAPGRILTRTGSRAGDWIYVTGRLGRSLPTGHHLKFRPRLAEGGWLARRAEVRAMMDVSDGLARDLGRLCPRGLVSALVKERIPRRDGATVQEALADGEDYELVFSVDRRADRAEFERAWRRKFPGTRATCIGRFVRPGSQASDAILPADFQGYEPFR